MDVVDALLKTLALMNVASVVVIICMTYYIMKLKRNIKGYPPHIRRLAEQIGKNIVEVPYEYYEDVMECRQILTLIESYKRSIPLFLLLVLLSVIVYYVVPLALESNP